MAPYVLPSNTFPMLIKDRLPSQCYIGHRRLSTAITTHLKTHPADTFKLTYHPFYLSPPTSETLSKPFFPVQPPSRLRSEVYAAKFGPQVVPQLFQRLGAAAAGDGLHFKFGGKTGPSRNGHRLVRYAQSHGGEDAQNKTMLGLWRRYYEEEVDITELEVLVEVGVEAGLGTAPEICDYLLARGEKKDEALRDARDIDRETEEASLGKGISGVPNYEIGIWGTRERYQVSGAQEPRLFETVFNKFKDLADEGKLTPAPVAQSGQADGQGKVKAAGDGPVLDGEACAIDGSGKC